MYLTNSLIEFCYSASSVKQQSTCRYVGPLEYIIPNSSKLVLLLRTLNGKTANTNLIVFALTFPGLEPTIHRTVDQHDITITALMCFWYHCSYAVCIVLGL